MTNESQENKSVPFCPEANSPRPLAEPVYRTNKEAKQAAEALGYKKSTKQSMMGKLFSNRKICILLGTLTDITEEHGKQLNRL